MTSTPMLNGASTTTGGDKARKCIQPSKFSGNSGQLSITA